MNFKLFFKRPSVEQILNFKFLIVLMMLFLGLSSPALALASTLSLAPSSGTFNQGCNFSLNINVDTQGVQTDGTDAILFYDPTRFTATTIQNGTIYNDYPGSNIDSQNGKITVSGLASVSSPFSGSGTLATVNFTVVSGAPTGATQITFDFDPNNKSKTTDSNVVEHGTVADTLSSVTNGSYTVGTGSCVGQGGTAGGGSQGGTASGSATPTAVPTLPKAGSESLTITLAILGATLTTLGVLGLAIL